MPESVQLAAGAARPTHSSQASQALKVEGTGGDCHAVSESCRSGADCFSGLCDDTQHCKLGSSFCVQPGDVCASDGECCTANCAIGDGQTIGTCAEPPKGPSYNPMNGGTNACNPEGNVCHYLQDQNYTCSSSAARSDCCGPETPKFLMCKLDGLGVPRCLGVGDCKAASETCASAADCCDQAPCVPDETGALRCLSPPADGPHCVPSDGACTINADCCPGGICNRPPGSTVGRCSVVQPPEGSGGAGGGYSGTAGNTGHGGMAGGGYTHCSEYGQLCTGDGDCCNGVPCTDGACVYVVK
ncbi:MAG TPA: hypothetical protein VGC79_36800 [Polyangiaceae bacterium]